MTAVQAFTPTEPLPPRQRRLIGPLATIGGLAAASLALHFRDPHAHGSWGLCPSSTIFGIDCPGCGGLRGVNDLTNFRFVDAASSNLLLVIALPFAIFYLARWAVDAWRGVRRTPSAPSLPLIAGLVVVVLTFTVLRNLAPFGWLAA